MGNLSKRNAVWQRGSSTVAMKRIKPRACKAARFILAAQQAAGKVYPGLKTRRQRLEVEHGEP